MPNKRNPSVLAMESHLFCIKTNILTNNMEYDFLI